MTSPSDSLAVRLGVVAFGATVYSLFLGTFVYAALFISGVFVPKHIDSGTEGSLTSFLLINLSVMSVFAIQHTIMARLGFKKWWTKIVHPAVERSIFVLVTCLILATLFWQWRPLSPVVWQFEHPLAVWGLWGLCITGYGIVLVSTFLIDHFELFGLKQAVLCFLQKPAVPKPFMTRGLYAYCRHPLMLGFLIAFWSTPTMTQGHLLFASVITAYILVALPIEERTLVAILGDDYRRYQKEVPKLLPLGRRWKTRAPGAPVILEAPESVAR